MSKSLRGIKCIVVTTTNKKKCYLSCMKVKLYDVDSNIRKDRFFCSLVLRNATAGNQVCAVKCHIILSPKEMHASIFKWHLAFCFSLQSSCSYSRDLIILMHLWGYCNSLIQHSLMIWRKQDFHPNKMNNVMPLMH